MVGDGATKDTYNDENNTSADDTGSELQFFSDDSQDTMQELSNRLGSGLENQLGKMLSASVGASKGDVALKDFSDALGVEPSQASAVAQEAIDGLISQTLTNIGMERTEALEAKWWKLPKLERASIATRLLNRDSSVISDLKKQLR